MAQVGTPANVVVHLVHGTWPYGWLRKRPPLDGRKPTWFEDHSQFRQTIRLLCHSPIVFVPHFWSGRNSTRSRDLAARQLAGDLADSIKKYKDFNHVVLAHSHGGTVASLALGILSEDNEEFQLSCKALICLSSPFAFIKDADIDQEYRFMIDLSTSICAALLYIVIAVYRDFGNYSTWIIVGLMIVIPLFIRFIVPLTLSHLMEQLSRWKTRDEVWRTTVADPTIPTFVLRATRDEATLTIGLAQSLSWAMNKTSINQITRLILVSVLTIPGLLIFLSLVDVQHTHIPLAIYCGVVFARGLLGIASLLSYGLVAFAVGFWDFLSWHNSIIEVDVAPSQVASVVTIYSDLGDMREDSLRHGIYDHVHVQVEIARLIEVVALGLSPMERMEARYRRRDPPLRVRTARPD